MRKRVAIGLATVALSLGAVNVSSASAQPLDKQVRAFIHFLCGDPDFQEEVAEELEVKANRGQCQKALREFFEEDGGL
jgi:hypothetical protein